MSVSSKVVKSPIGVLEWTIKNINELGVSSVAANEKQELLGSVVFDIHYSKFVDKGEVEPSSFSLYLECHPKGQEEETEWEKSYAVKYELQIVRSEGTAWSDQGIFEHVVCEEEDNWGDDEFMDLKTLRS